MNEFVPVNWKGQGGSIIKVIGVGGGGNNAVRNMYNMGIEGVDFIVCNTDEQVLLRSPIAHKIQLGVTLTRGRGAGCNPEQGRKAAVENLEEIKAVLADNTEMVFITAGMGGGTGTGAAPVIAKEAKEMGILTVAIVTLPFLDEGNEPFNRALDGLQELRQYVDSMLVINNQKLYEIYPDLSVFAAFPKADDIVAMAAKGIAELITKEGYINVDFADVKMVMKDSGMALMGTGRASGENRALCAAELALNSPLLSDSDIAGAKNILVNISSGTKNPLMMAELGQIMNYINVASGGRANFKRGVTEDPSLDEDIAVTLVATGFPMSALPELEAHMRVDGEKVALSEPANWQVNSEEIHERNTPIDLTNTLYVREIEVKNVKPTSPEQTKEQEVNSSTYNQASLTVLKEKDIIHLEDIPAYERKNINLNMKPNTAGEISRHKLEEKDGSYTLNSNNSFLDQNVD